MKWVKLKKYCELSGDTASAVHTRRNRGIWLDGVESRVWPDGNLWINVKEVDRWSDPLLVLTKDNFYQEIP